MLSQQPTTLVLAALFLILTPFAVLLQSRSKGLTVWIAKSGRCAGDRDPVTVTVLPKGKLQLGTVVIDGSDLDEQLRTLLLPRATRLVFVQGAPGLAFEEVSSVISKVKAHAEIVAIVTPAVRGCAEVEIGSLEAWCGTSRPNPVVRSLSLFEYSWRW